MTAVSDPVDSEKLAAIRSVRRVATGILIFLTLVFIGSFLVPDPPTWLLLVRAMAEAGMVGGLADWFAVEALFRHPLRLPIPHTALLPKNQKRAAGNIARFIDEHFLVPDQLLAQVRKLNPVNLLAKWLSSPDNSALVARELSHLLHLVVHSQLRGGLGNKATGILRDLLLNSVDSNDLSQRITRLLKETVHSELLDEILIEVRDVLDQNRNKVTEVVQERSRWWIASAVDTQIVRILVDGILSIIDELADAKSDLRRDFDTSVVHLIDNFQQAGRIAHYVEEGREKYASSPEFPDTVNEIVNAVLARIDRGFEDHPDQVADLLADAVQEFSRMLLDKPELEAQLNDRLLAGLGSVLDEIRPAIMEYITRIIAEWDSDELVERIENEVGRDLQFIRINGAVLGAFVGGFLFLITRTLH